MVRKLSTNAFLNALRQSFALLFPLISIPYVTRILGNDGFGKYNFSWSIVSYFVLFAAFGINNYAIREGAKIRDDRNRLNSFCSEIFTINLFTSVISIFTLLTLTFISKKLSSYGLFIVIESISILLSFLGRDWINSIFEDYLYLTIRYVIIQIIGLVLLFLFINDEGDTWKYCLILVFTSFGGNIPNLIYIKKYTNTKLVLSRNLFNHIKPLAIFFVTQIAITVYVNIDITMLGFIYDDSVVGIYGLTSKIYSMIKTVINAVIIVTLPRLSYLLVNDSSIYKQMVAKIFSCLYLLIVPVASLQLMLSEDVLLLAGGSSYITGNNALKILSISIVFALLNSFFMNSILIVNGLEGACLKATITTALLNIVLNIFILPLWGMTGAAITTAISEFLNLFILVYFSHKSRLLFPVDIKTIIQAIICAVPIYIICPIFSGYGLVVRVSLSLLCSLFTYLILLLLLKNEYALNAVKRFKIIINK